MNRVLQKIFNGVVTVALASSVAVALESEYKNSLEKIELQKTSDSSYNINIYTQKQYLEPVKIIKKSDLNYYILLPETKNVSQGANFNSADIRNVIAKTFPYASQDIENGYTKININTTKPINFTVNARTKATLAASSKPQKKNSETSRDISQETKEKIAQTQQTRPNINLQPKKQSAIDASKLPVIQTQKPSQITQEQSGQDYKKAEKIKDKKVVEKPLEKTAEKTDIRPLEKQIEKQIIKKEIQSEKPIGKRQLEKQPGEPVVERQAGENTSAKNIEEKILEDQKRIVEEQTQQEHNDLYTNQGEHEIDTSLETEELYGVIDTLKYKLSRCAQNLYDSLMVTIASVVGLIIVVLLFARRPKNNARLKNKADLRSKLENESLVAKKSDNDDTANAREQFFIIKEDKPLNEQNYELSDFEKELEDASSKIEPYNEDALARKVQNEQDYDTIQKILKEENLQIDANNAQVELEQEKTTSEAEEKIQEEVNKEVEQAIKELEQEELEKPPVIENVENDFKNKPSVVEQVEPFIQANEQNIPAPTSAPVVDDTRDSSIEPIVLTKVEIAPERGFMCIKFENNVSLMGYMFDDVYVLHNFKREKLDDYSIKYRVTDKDSEGTSYIVKVSDAKLIVKVTASKMRLEVLM